MAHRLSIPKSIRRIAMCLIFGACINIAIAWGCAIKWPITDAVGLPLSAEQVQWWQSVAPASFPHEPSECYRHAIGGREYVLLVSHSTLQSSQMSYLAYRYRSGWPLRSLEESRWCDFERGDCSNNGIIAARWIERHLGRLPVRPLPLEFLINTLLFGSAVWLLAFGPCALRSHWRARHGRCPACEYPIGTSAVCTECGRTLPAASRTPKKKAKPGDLIVG